jgi:EthD domain-containing protein
MYISLGFYKRKPGTSWEEFSRHWREVHGPLIANNPKLARYQKRYVQHHLQPNDCFPGVDPLPFDGFSEAWFDTIDDRRRLWEEPDFQKFVVPDEALFLDLSATKISMIDQQIVHVGGDVAAAFAAGATSIVIR